MLAAVSTHSAMYFTILVVTGIALCLATPVVHSQYTTCPAYPISYELEQQIVDTHNRLRSKVYPYASNMRTMVHRHIMHVHGSFLYNHTWLCKIT